MIPLKKIYIYISFYKVKKEITERKKSETPKIMKKNTF